MYPEPQLSWKRITVSCSTLSTEDPVQALVGWQGMVGSEKEATKKCGGWEGAGFSLALAHRLSPCPGAFL